ncbi:MAG: hemolysin family protein [Planctomycetota bacterium]
MSIVAFLPQALLMLALLAGSAICSATETALFSLTETRWRALGTRGFRGRLVVRLRSSPRDLLVTLLLANLVVNLAYFSLAAAISLDLEAAGRLSASVTMGVASVAVLLLCGEILPKVVAVRRPDSIALTGALPVFAFVTVARPVIRVLSFLVGRITDLLVALVKTPAHRGVKLLHGLLDLSMERGDLLDEERSWLREVLNFSNLRARDVMVPRVDMATIDLTGSRAEALEVVRRTKFSRLPAHTGSPDRVEGFIAGRDLFLWPEKPLQELVQPILVTPDTASVEQLLRRMRREGHALTLVVDEYGGCEGLIALEDIVHEIVGEVGDEHSGLPVRLQLLGPGRFRVAGSLSIRDWNNLGGLSLPADRAASVGGLVTAILDRPPVTGDSVEIGALRLIVRLARRGRVIWLEVLAGERLDD